jgi:ribosomal protein S18 acetylase RimI-like enzyme
MAQYSETDAQHIGTLWMLRTDRPLPAGPVPRVPATFTRTGPETVQELTRVMELDRPAVILQRFAAGRHCYVARAAGQLATYGWVTFDEELIGELGLSIRLKAGEAYIWDCATLPAYRGQRLYPALLSHMLKGLQAEGVQRVWIGTDTDNRPSQKGVALAGFQAIADILMDNTPTKRKAWLRGRNGTDEQDLEDVHCALFGNRDHRGLHDAYRISC